MFNKRKPDDPKLSYDAGSAPVREAPVLTTAEDDIPDLPPNPPSLKEYPMARSPFAPPLPASTSTLRPSINGAPPPVLREENGQRRTLVVGRGISVQGTVQDAERLVVEGTVEATMINGLTELAIAHGGIFKGEVEVDEAEVAGTIDGTLVARHALIVRASGRVLGTARCRRLQVEDGGQITGRIEMLSDALALPDMPT